MSAVSLLPTPALVVFGRDQAGKPHASWFDQGSAELATKAAGMMNMDAVPVSSDELRAFAGSLPRGRVFASGKAFTPFISGALFTRLVELTRGLLGSGSQAVTATPASEAGDGEGAQAGAAEDNSLGQEPAEIAEAGFRPSPRPIRPEEVGLGSLVLATTGPTEGWYEAHVIGLNGGMFTLKFCDFVEPTIVRRITEIGFLPTPPA